jgi:hypothetical protein
MVDNITDTGRWVRPVRREVRTDEPTESSAEAAVICGSFDDMTGTLSAKTVITKR